MTTPQNFINSLQVALPCPASWADMRGDDRARFCAQCEKHVYDFSKLTAAEGLALIREKEGNVCGRLWRRADGTVITADCPVGARTLLARKEVRLPMAAAAVIAMSLSSLACGPKVKPQAAPTAPMSAQAPNTHATMTTTLDYTGAVPVANVTIHDSAAPFAVMSVGNLISGDTCMPGLDMSTATQGVKLSHEDWDHLPIR